MFVSAEILNHPAGEDRQPEPLEDDDAGPAGIDISGERFSRGVLFVFPDKPFLRVKLEARALPASRVRDCLPFLELPGFPGIAERIRMRT